MREYSKRILAFSYALLIVLLLLLLAAEEKEALGGIVCAWIAECGAATGFYFWKAKNENRSKYAMKFVRELADRVDRGERLALQCWCKPKDCHGDVVRELILRELGSRRRTT